MRRRRAQHEGLQSCGLADDMLWRISDAMDRGLAHGVYSDAVAVDSSLSLLGWGQTFLPHYFRRAPSLLHRQLERWAGEAQAQRGLKLNVIGPRGGAKSTVATLAWVLSGRRGAGTVRLDRLRYQTAGRESLGKSEV